MNLADNTVQRKEAPNYKYTQALMMSFDFDGKKHGTIALTSKALKVNGF